MKYLNFFKRRRPVKKEDINSLFKRIKEDWESDKNPYKINYDVAHWRSEKYKDFNSKIVSLTYNSLDCEEGTIFLDIIGDIINYRYDNVWSTAIGVNRIWDSEDNDHYYDYKTIDGGMRESFIQAIIKMRESSYDPILPKHFNVRGKNAINFYEKRKLIFDLLDDISDDYNFNWKVYRPLNKEDRSDFEWNYKEDLKKIEKGNIMGVNKFFTKLDIKIESNNISHLLKSDIFSRLERDTDFIKQTVQKSDFGNKSFILRLNYIGEEISRIDQ